ncbi:MAG: NAD(P)H-binding protein [Thermoplasmata archaeon]|nr:NAD(P)H-binding protein [Thermoplasmata archaeon]
MRAFSRAGYRVRGLVRSPAAAARVRVEGGEAVQGDVLDPGLLKAALAGCAGVIHVASNSTDPLQNSCVRVEGTRNLVEASGQGGVSRMVIGSGYWVYRGQSEPIMENSPLEPLGESRVNFEAELVGREATALGELGVLVVRPGMVYGDGSWFRGLAESVRVGEYRVVGDGMNRWSFIDRWDAGTAFLRVFEAGTPGEIYNAVDGHPAPLREFAAFVAAELSVPPPTTLSLPEAITLYGELVARHLAADRPASGAKLIGLGWQPLFTSFKEGVPRLLREMFPRAAA